MANTTLSYLVEVYAKLILFISIHLIKFAYKEPNTCAEFSPEKHDKMTKLKNFAEKVFDRMVAVVGEKTKYEYTMPFDYKGSKMLIRPFIFSEILMVSGLWEPYVRAIVDREVRESDTVVNVGANIGIYVIPLAKRVSKVIAFEPHPKTYEILEKSIELNNLHNVVLVKKAIGDSKKKVLFGLSVIPMESGIITEPSRDTYSGIEVESVDLDSALVSEDRVDWLLIDVEGSEINVLKGARNILRKNSPKIIFENFRENIDSVKNMLAEEGYSVVHVYDIYYYAVKTNPR
jgi:FkbM family methyltransferase